MPPKKSTTTSTDNGETESGPFRWTAENERKLLVLIQGRQLNGAEYERLLTVFPGTNLNGIKIRCSRLRVEQRKLYEEYGWDLEAGITGSATLKKRGAAKSEEGTPKKKVRVKKEEEKAVKKAEEMEGEEEEDDEETKDGVKEEALGEI